MTFVADRGDAAARLDQAILRHLPSAFALSRSAVQRLVASGRVLVNDRPARRPAQRLAPGDVVAIDAAPRATRAAPAAESVPLAIVYEDADLLVVAKPPGMVAHPTARQRHGTVVNALLGLGGGAWTPRLVQRLDRGTSGLMVVAKSAEAQAALQAAGAAKDYLAVVWGRPSPARGVLDGRLGRDPLDRRRMMVKATGAPSTTDYTVLARATGDAAGVSVLRCRLGTGRTHQIRVHLADRGWPIVGDPTYGSAPRRRLIAPDLDRLVRGFPRQALHAWRLSLKLPSSGARLTFVAPVPADLAGLLQAIGLGRFAADADPAS